MDETSKSNNEEMDEKKNERSGVNRWDREEKKRTVHLDDGVDDLDLLERCHGWRRFLIWDWEEEKVRWEMMNEKRRPVWVAALLLPHYE